jgi:hypothetical protein
VDAHLVLSWAALYGVVGVVRLNEEAAGVLDLGLFVDFGAVEGELIKGGYLFENYEPVHRPHVTVPFPWQLQSGWIGCIW